MDAPLHPQTIARLIVPSRALDGCAYAYLWRDLRGARELSDPQCRSWFPATPLCGFSWMLGGRAREVREDGSVAGELGDELPDGLVGGPRSGPRRFHSTPDGRCFMAAIQPEALHALTGVDLATLKDRQLPLSALDAPGDSAWADLDRSLRAACDEHEARDRLEAFLLPRWRAVRERATASVPHGYGGWMQHLALRAVAAGHGRSLRQAERRIKQWSGQSLRALRLISRAEAAFHEVRRLEADEGAVLWSALAQDHGYADQAHLCREVRRISGFSPEDLRRRVAADEAFWPYRIWV